MPNDSEEVVDFMHAQPEVFDLTVSDNSDDEPSKATSKATSKGTSKATSKATSRDASKAAKATTKLVKYRSPTKVHKGRKMVTPQSTLKAPPQKTESPPRPPSRYYIHPTSGRKYFVGTCLSFEELTATSYLMSLEPGETIEMMIPQSDTLKSLITFSSKPVQVLLAEQEIPSVHDYHSNTMYAKGLVSQTLGLRKGCGSNMKNQIKADDGANVFRMACKHAGCKFFLKVDVVETGSNGKGILGFYVSGVHTCDKKVSFDIQEEAFDIKPKPSKLDYEVRCKGNADLLRRFKSMLHITTKPELKWTIARIMAAIKHVSTFDEVLFCFQLYSCQAHLLFIY